MIEIIKHGNKEKYWSVTTRCPECGCIFKFNPFEDTYHERIFCEDRVDCPDCGNEITVHNTSCWNDDPERVVCEIIKDEIIDD